MSWKAKFQIISVGMSAKNFHSNPSNSCEDASWKNKMTQRHQS